MGIEDKSTYGEYYWAMQVEAQAAFDEQVEKALSPFFAGLFADVPELSELPTGIQQFVRSLAEPPSAGFGKFLTSAAGEFGAEVVKDLIKPAMSMMQRSINRKALETWLTSTQANKLFREGKIDEPYWDLITTSEGYHNTIGRQLYESELPYPSIPDIMLYARYHGDADNTKEVVWDLFDVPIKDYELWEWLSLQRLNTQQLQTMFRRGSLTQEQLHKELAQIGWSPLDRLTLETLSWTIPNSMLLVQGDLLQGKSHDTILKDISIGDINPVYAQKYYDAIMTKPASQDIIAYELRRDATLSNLSPELRRIGIHEDYHDLYKELAYQIPPVADIITMAVREAFTPDIATRFGQYEDFPAEFEEWAAKKGLAPEWAKRYWAAHWSLPSPLQGFEMLHRGLINSDELDMLLRALDIMPFWRDKLTGIAYKRISRVDIRRMYRVGVLTEAEVYESYLELGYTERDSKRLSDFTVKQVLATQSKFTARDIISAYTKYMINSSEAGSLLRQVGVKDENISYILSTADYKREWALTESRIAAIRNLYKKKVYSANDAKSELLKLDMPSVRVEVLMEQWFIDEKDKPPRYWTTAQTIGFVKEGLITPERGREELVNIGYNEEHINVYMKEPE